MRARAQGVVGIVLLLMGLVWIFQGLNVLPGSFMSGQPAYAFLGSILVLVGGALAWRWFVRSRE